MALIWALVALGRLIRLAIDFRELAAIRRESSLRSHAYDFPIYESNRVRVPIAIGFANPAVILPATLFEHVDERGVEAILIHETAHLRRYDVWTNVFAQVIQALLALNPVSWFVAREISTQREIACDDWVVARTHWSEAFVRALTSMADGTRTRMPVAAPSALGSRRVIINRVEQLLDDARQRNLHFSRVSLSVAGVLLTLIAFTLQALSPALAFQPPADTPAQHSGITLALSCTQRERNGGPFRAHTYGPGGPRMGSPSLDDHTLQRMVSRYPAGTTTYAVNVDAAGRPHNFTVLHPSNYPGLDQRVSRSVLTSKFDPAHRDCVAISSTFKSASTRLPAPQFFVVATRLPVKPVTGSNTKVRRETCMHRNPSIVNLVRPQFSGSMKEAAKQQTFMNAVIVRVNASGSVTSATKARAFMAESSGQSAFDDAIIAAAKRSRYAPGLVNCTPTPSEYVIRSALTQWLEP